MKKTIADFQPLKPAEEKLLECCLNGEVAVIGKERPTEKTEANEIRSAFIRWLILTKEKEIEIDPNGIQVQGAWISGMLDLENVVCETILNFNKCCFEGKIYLMRAITKTIYLEGSFCQKGIYGDGLVCHGNLHLRNSFEVHEEVRFLGAKVEGNLDCTQANFKALSVEQNALSCDRINVHGNVFLKGSSSEGEVRFLGAKVEGNLDCSEATFKALNEKQQALHCDGIIVNGDMFLRGSNAQGEVRFLGAKVEGDFDCSQAMFQSLNEKQKAFSCDKIAVNGNVFLKSIRAKGEVRFLGAKFEGDFNCTQATFQALNEKQNALCCDGMNVVGGLFIRNECKVIQGIVNLESATVGSVVDDKDFWEQKTLKYVQLNGFKYGHIYGDTSAPFRLQNMLAKMTGFKPQPYKQLAKVLRDMGHDRDADEVMIALRDKQLEESEESKIYKWLRKFYKWTSAYGYRPMRTLKIMFWVWLGCGFFYWGAANVAVFAPTNPLVFQKKDYNCTIDTTGTSWDALLKDYNASNNWYEASPAEYTTFQPFWYSLDIILPVVDLKMENDWGIVIPSPEGSWSDMIPFTTTNHFIRFLTWVESLAGWGLSLMLVAILSGLAKNEKE